MNNLWHSAFFPRLHFVLVLGNHVHEVEMQQQRSCTPTRVSEAGDTSPFFLNRRSWDRVPTDFSAASTPPRTPVLMERASSNEMPLPSSATAFGPFSNSSLCTPQTSRQELDLRASLDFELNRINEEARCRQSTFPVLLVQLEEYLFIGPFPTEDTARLLQANGVEVVINCCAGERPTVPAMREMFVVEDIPAIDSPDHYILTHDFARFASIVNDSRRAGKKIFVHCVAGVNRSAVLCAAYLMKAKKMGPVEVVRQFRQCGKYCLLENVAFRHQLVSEYLSSLCCDNGDGFPC